MTDFRDDWIQRLNSVFPLYLSMPPSNFPCFSLNASFKFSYYKRALGMSNTTVLQCLHKGTRILFSIKFGIFGKALVTFFFGSSALLKILTVAVGIGS